VEIERVGRPGRAVGRHPIRYAARAAGLHAQTLRDYERRGLLRPARTDGGMRLFSDDDVARARRIAELSAEGVPLTATQRILRLERLLRLLFARIRTLEDQNARLSARLQRQQVGARPSAGC